jgi:hydroxypyruvate reductase
MQLLDNPKNLLLELYNTAVDSVHPARCVPPFLPPPPAGRTIVIGAGKGAAAMARAVETNWDSACEGMVVTRYGHGVRCQSIRVIEAGHPVPDDVGQTAARAIIELVSDLTKDDLVLCLISGGGSALLSLPALGVTLADKQHINQQLLKSGANISEINTVRKHLSAIKGGQLALQCAPAQVATLIISDVPGDDPATVASGPTVPDHTTQQDALTILDRYNIDTGDHIISHLSDPKNETPKPGDPRFERVSNTVIATARQALQAAASLCDRHGIQPVVLGDDIEGEATEVAIDHAARATRVLQNSDDRPCVILSGGETTVTVRGGGRGGRNVEYLLGLAIALGDQHSVYALACDTDGIDGTEDNAGAVMTPNTLERARAMDLDPAAYLENNDAYGFFSALDDLVVTGPTLTNVNDFRAIFVSG